MAQNTASQRIASELEAQIRSGRIAPGERVPSAREIVSGWGVAIATASKVLAILKKKGLVRPERGIGTVVRAREGRNDPSRDQIVRAAIAVADEEGEDGLSLRRVATELAVPTLVVQRAFGDTESLLLAMAETVLAEALPTRLRGTWRQRLEQVARAQWTTYGQHPWLVHTLSMTRPQLLPNGMHHTEIALEAIEELGLGHVATLRAGVSLFAYVRGMAVGLEAERVAEQDTGMSSDEWIEAREHLFQPLAQRFPTIARLTIAPDIDMSLDALFECGLRYFLDGLAAATRPAVRAHKKARVTSRAARGTLHA